MSLLLEHDDLKKARRALMIASVIAITLQYTVMTSSTLKILNLEFVVSIDQLVISGRLIVLYLLYNFLMRLFVDKKVEILSRLKELSRALGPISVGSKSMGLPKAETVVSNLKADFQRIIRDRSKLVFDFNLVIDVITPVFIALLALSEPMLRLAEKIVGFFL